MSLTNRIQLIAIGLLASGGAFAGLAEPPGENDLPLPAAWALIAIGGGLLYFFRRK
jgi:hypothetical protein